MSIYLGYMNVYEKPGYSPVYNFYPTHEYVNKRFEPINESLFPDFCNLFIHFSGKRYDSHLEDHIKDKEFCIIKIDEEDKIKHNDFYNQDKDITRFGIDFISLTEQNKVFSLNKFNVYPIVTPKNGKEVSFEKDTVIEVEEDFPIHNYMKQGLLCYEGEYYGPFELGLRTIDKQLYIKIDQTKNKYTTNKYSLSDDFDDKYDNILVSTLKGWQYRDFLFVDENYSIETFDYITDEILLDYYCKSLKQIPKETSQTDIFSIIQKLREISDIFDVDEEIALARKERLNKILTNIEIFKTSNNLLTESILSIFSISENKQLKQEIIDQIINNPQFLNNIQGYKIVSDKILERTNELKELENKKQELENNVSHLESKYKEEALSKIDTDKDLDLKIKEKEEQLAIILRKLNLLDNIDTLEEKNKAQEKIYEDGIYKIRQLQDKLDEKISQTKKSIDDILLTNKLDKYILKKIYDGFEIDELNEEISRYRECVKAILNNKENSMSGKELIDYLVNEISSYRPTYNRNMIINILICLNQGFLTVFSGEPGTGKTSICKIVAHVLGLDQNFDSSTECNSSRFNIVAVEKGWTSKRDLIGYYNPLSKRIEKTNAELYDGLRILNEEKEHSKFPFIVLMDEANLSPIEYYWADFVNISDNQSNELGKIDLGNGENIYIPQSLRFLATINNDHTVERLSPRIIDRSFVILLPEEIATSCKMNLNDKYLPVTWDSINKALSTSATELNKESLKILDEIKKIFMSLGEKISPRTEIMIRKYCLAAQEHFVSENNIDASIIALDYAIAQKILPRIQGHGEDYREKLCVLKEYCVNNNLNSSAKILENILSFGDSHFMGNYDFFH